MNKFAVFKKRLSALSVAAVLGGAAWSNAHADVAYTLTVAGVDSITDVFTVSGEVSNSILATLPADSLTSATLAWDGDADLDLFAVMPDGITVLSFDNTPITLGAGGTATHQGDVTGGLGSHVETILFAGDLDPGVYEFFATAFAVNTPEAQEEAVEDATVQVTEVQVSTVASNVTTRVRTAFRSISFSPAPTPGPAPQPGGAPGGPAGGAEVSGIHYPGSGRAAGSLADTTKGVWVSPSYTSFESSTGSGHSGETLSLGAGIDALVDDNTVVGVSLSIEQSETDMKGALTGNSLEAKGVSVVAYAGRQLAEGLLVDGFIGFGMLENETEQAANKANFDSNRFMIGGTLSKQFVVGDSMEAVVSGGLTHSTESFDGYTLGTTTIASSDTSLTTGNIELELSGRVDGRIYPYGLVGVEHQIENSASDEETSLVIGAGMSYLASDDVLVEFSVIGREADENSSVTGSASVRWTFR